MTKKKIKTTDGDITIDNGTPLYSPQPTPQDIPWITMPQYVPWIEVEESEATWTSQVKFLSFSRLASAWTTTTDFTWFWFTPTSYKVTSWTSVSAWNVCEWTYDGATETWYYIRSYLWLDIWTTGRVISIRTSASNKTYGAHDSFIDDGVRIDFSNSDENISLTITAYK